MVDSIPAEDADNGIIRSPCRRCAELIAANARICRFCGEKEPLLSERARAANRERIMAWIGIGAIVIVGGFLLLALIGSQLPHEAQAKENVRQASRDPQRVEFGHTWWGSTGKTRVLCGSANFPNGFGGMAGERRFISSEADGGLVLIEGEAPVVAGLDEFETAFPAWCEGANSG